MIELILGTYGIGCWLLFKKFKLIPVTTYTVCTAILGGFGLLMGILIILALCHPVSHDGRFYAAVTPIVPQVRGIVVDVPVVANTPVKAGDVLFRIEQRPYQLEVDRLEAKLAGMNANVAKLSTQFASAEAATQAARYNLLVSESEFDRQARISLDQATASIKQTQVRLDLANSNLERLRKLLPKGAVTQEEFDTTAAEVAAIKAQLSQAQAGEKSAQEKIDSGGNRLQAARSELAAAEAAEQEASIAVEAESDGLNPDVRQTMAELDRKRWELEQTIVRAPSDGYATHVSLRPGQMATTLPLTAPMVFVPTEKRALIATFPQTAIGGFEPGLEAELAFKAYPGRIFKATVRNTAPIIPEGQVLADGQLRSATSGAAAGYIPVVFEYGEDVEALNLPTGAQCSVAVYTHNFHAISIVRKMILRIKSWENYLFFMQNVNALH